MKKRLRPAVFLDRDGTLNEEKDYVHRIEDWKWIPGAVRAVRELNRMGFRVIVVTNQAGIARGYYGTRDMDRLHRHVARDLSRRGGKIHAFYHCPHHPEFGRVRNCRCRKPRPGLLLRARRDHALDMSRSFMVGDKLSDVKAGRAAGVVSLLVATGHGRTERGKVPRTVPVAKDLLQAVRWIKERAAR